MFCIGIGNPDEEAGQPELHGKKGTFNEDDAWEGWAQGKGKHRSKSKFRFFWDGDTQRREWAY